MDSRIIEFAREKHKGQTRKDGSDYIIHPIAVATYLKEKGYDEKYQIAGIFHDLLEDTDSTEYEILSLSNQDVLTAVKLVSKNISGKGTSYIDNILLNPIAKAVKNADRIHNLTDAVNAKVKFSRYYLKDTEKYYLGRFSDELDNAYRHLKDVVENYSYVINGDMGDSSLVYRVYEKEKLAWVFNKKADVWEKANPFFCVKIGSNAKKVTEKQAASIIKKEV